MEISKTLRVVSSRRRYTFVSIRSIEDVGGRTVILLELFGSHARPLTQRQLARRRKIDDQIHGRLEETHRGSRAYVMDSRELKRCF